MARQSPSPGVSLSRTPVGLLGVAGVVYGVLALIFGGNSFALRIPHGHVGDGHFIGLLTNGWTDLLFVAAGLLLVLGAKRHWAARSAALIVAFALAAAAVIAVIRGDGVFGIFAANGRTEIVWGAAAIALVVLARLPRVGGGTGGGSATGGGGRRGATTLGGGGTAGDDPLVSSR